MRNLCIFALLFLFGGTNAFLAGTTARVHAACVADHVVPMYKIPTSTGGTLKTQAALNVRVTTPVSASRLSTKKKKDDWSPANPNALLIYLFVLGWWYYTFFFAPSMDLQNASALQIQETLQNAAARQIQNDAATIQNNAATIQSNAATIQNFAIFPIF